MTDDIPRRSRLDKMTPAENAIYNAMCVVEQAGCDVRLTEAVNLLQKARDRVADFVDGVGHPLLSYPTDVAGLAVENLRLARARIKSLEDGIVAENRRTSVIEQELQAVKDVLIARDEDFHPEGLVSVAEVVARILNERDRVRNEYEVSLSRVHEEASTATDVLCGALGPDHGRGGLVEHCQKAAEKIGELEKDGVLLSDTVKKLSDMLVTWATVVPCRCGCDTCRRGGHLVCSKCLSRSVLTWEDGQRLALTDALFREHQIEGDETLRDVVVRLANAAATRTRELETATAECLAWHNAMKNVFHALGRDMSGMKTPQELAEQAVKKIREEQTESRLYSDCLRQSEGEEVAVKAKLAELLADQRATGDVLAGILGRERCEDGNVCLANDVALKVEGIEDQIRSVRSAVDALALYVESGFSNKNSGGSGAAQADVAQRGQSNEGTHGPLDRPASPEPAGGPDWDAKRDLEWILAMAEALGTNSGLSVPIVPDVEAFRKLFEEVRARARVHAKWAEIPRPYTKPKLTELVSREQLVAACREALKSPSWWGAFEKLASVLEKGS